MPATYSIIANYFASERRGRPVGLIGMSSALGASLSFLIGSGVLTVAPEGSGVVLPLIGAVVGWQVAFLVAGSPGLLICLVMLAIHDPRAGAEGARSDQSGP